MKLVFLRCAILALGGTAFITACNGDAVTPTAPTGVAAPAAGPDISLFLAGALARGVTTEPCTLSGGTATTCYRITVVGLPVGHAVGPFWPADHLLDGRGGGYLVRWRRPVRPGRGVHQGGLVALRRRQLVAL